MSTRRFFYLLIAVAGLVVVAACAPQSQPTPAAQSIPVAALVRDEPTTLHLAVSDAEADPSGPSVLEFVEQVRDRSDGDIVIVPVWDAGAATDAGFEQGVVAAVRAGEYELGLAASRAWEQEGITVFRPLQTPFLIDDDALAIAYVTSDVATQMLERLSASGIAGLTIWPEDLRHPFSAVPGKPLLSPDDFAGAKIRTTSLGITAALVEALGGSPEFMTFNYQGTESGFRQGSTLSGQPIATGNVVFFPKFQVLFANSAAFEQLSEAQRVILREAAAATQEKTIADRPSDVDLVLAWCADGGTVVLAGEAQLAALVEAAQPVIDQVEADPTNAEAVAAIRSLKANTQPGPAVMACGNVAAQPAPNEEEQTWSQGLPPNGTWMVELTIEDVVAMGVLQSNAAGWAGTSIYEFQDGEGTFHGEFLDGYVIVCPFTYEVVEDFFRITYVDLGLENYLCEKQVDDLKWRLDEEGLHFNVVAIHEGLLAENTALYEAKPWQKVEE